MLWVFLFLLSTRPNLFIRHVVLFINRKKKSFEQGKKPFVSFFFNFNAWLRGVNPREFIERQPLR